MTPTNDLSCRMFDLVGHEQSRLAAVLAAGGDLAPDPGAVLAAEAAAHRMLYSDLDPEQQRIYQMLVDAGVLGA